MNALAAPRVLAATAAAIIAVMVAAHNARLSLALLPVVGDARPAIEPR